MTIGETFFYAGIGGMAAVAVIGIISVFLLSGTRKKLNKKFNEEYGMNNSISQR
ncbi:MAG: hypothetical protein LBC41_08350 [Clostridiales bacterium]|jgi:hypothetical protein|nr:hypothetical protein [Clostridiales bacterium]MDR2750655.1 hypothetical protein [Clostridiales bacterium]